jgi:thioredoxin 1
MWLFASLLIGGGVGGLLGYLGRCSSGMCPLTANPWRGAMIGAVLGLLFYTGSGHRGHPTGSASSNVRQISEMEFDAEVKNSTTPVLVDFFATWCGPCKVLSPRLDELAGSFTNRVKFVKVDVDQSPGLAREFGIEGVPTLLFFRNGKLTNRLVGVQPTSELTKQLEVLTMELGQRAAVAK